MSTPSPQTYRRHLIWPVLNDDTNTVDYYDIHGPEDHNGNGEPIAEAINTIAEAKQWINERIHDERMIAALDRLGAPR